MLSWFRLSQLLSPDKDVMLRFDGIRQSEEDRTRSAIIPEFSEITADLITHNLLVLQLRVCRLYTVVYQNVPVYIWL